jgi:hypothetical protein
MLQQRGDRRAFGRVFRGRQAAPGLAHQAVKLLSPSQVNAALSQSAGNAKVVLVATMTGN